MEKLLNTIAHFSKKMVLGDRVKFSTNKGQIFHRFFHRLDFLLLGMENWELGIGNIVSGCIGMIFNHRERRERRGRQERGEYRTMKRGFDLTRFYNWDATGFDITDN
ncbi:hypothetical protein QT970_20540 [Microcoleus sp. herbarium8]|uniref:hypothetical protein n=1 Tax=unclassified Microcoleus TaxID=2642155 RepID=UPI002FD02E79